jgi:hypothetical protein
MAGSADRPKDGELRSIPCELLFSADTRMYGRVMHRTKRLLGGQISKEQPIGGGSEAERTPIRGWLIVYLVVLAGLAAHGLELTIASLIISADPSLAGLTSFVPVPALIFYVTSNTLLVFYIVLLYVLMARRKRSAIAHNVVFNALSVAFLLGWHVFHMKSTLGVAIDIVPSILMTAYILTSKRVKQTLRR